MTTQNNDENKKTLSLSGSGKLGLKNPVDTSPQARQNLLHGRSKTVTVEVRRKRTGESTAHQTAAARQVASLRLTDDERDARERALRGAIQEDMRKATETREDEAANLLDTKASGQEDTSSPAESMASKPEETPNRPMTAAELRQHELNEMRRIQDNDRKASAEAERILDEANARTKRDQEDASPAANERPAPVATDTTKPASGRGGLRTLRMPSNTDDDGRGGRGKGRGNKGSGRRDTNAPMRGNRLNVREVLSGGAEELQTRARSIASIRRAAEKARIKARSQQQEQQKIVRDVTIPDAITVQELANRMAERGASVIKSLMKMGVMATINQVIDADTAELVAAEFGHRINRVSENDIEQGLLPEICDAGNQKPRPPVVTIMGHVDHGKTSLLDAIRKTDVVSGEAGGITQHIGAYQVVLPNKKKITFIDTPGHAAFSEMRARGANVTDVVVLVVAANDSIMPQTIEAINHAQAAKVPMIIAINKCDLPDARPDKVRQELLNHNIVVEEMGGETLAVEVSAKTRKGLDKLEEAILLQAEILDLTSNPDCPARGHVVEAKLEKGRGPVATVLVQSGTIKVGDIFVSGSEWGRVRALLNDRGQSMDDAPPATPVEVLGLSGTPLAGDDFVVVENEARAREIAEYRMHRKRELQSVATATGRGTVEDMLSQIKAGIKKELPLIVKADVHGSVEAIATSVHKLAEGHAEVAAHVIHSGVGAINESDLTLAKATGALIFGFNVRANTQAREIARRDGIDIRYYSIIYNLIDDVKAMLGGMLKPTMKENFLGNAEIRQVFNVTKVGKVAGCMVTEGLIKRGAKVRLLRDNVVIHEGSLKTLKRFKDEVKEVREGYDCGMAFENYDNIEVGDVIEAFEVEEVARTL
ncbi:MAG TPA: translation initiation factor IF-2 [Rhodospirillaceae bacterium]|nr:MAG: translation initiation factor IF-2 [Alphaproteobacteria bacterium GWF2_58_20]HAU29263.1 translation initiation factor IF-2 [Rhodospirillaceae bacterium]